MSNSFRIWYAKVRFHWNSKSKSCSRARIFDTFCGFLVDSVEIFSLFITICYSQRFSEIASNSKQIFPAERKTFNNSLEFITLYDAALMFRRLINAIINIRLQHCYLLRQRFIQHFLQS